MDIAAPPIDRRVAPSPHLLRTQRLDKRGVIRELIRQHPEAGPDEIAALCAKWGLHVSAMLVARMVQTLRAEEGRSPAPESAGST
jgi:hypothetical protein